ncbi:MAG: DUF5681 domain-containing protein [Sphingobium sp.]|nr:DUF5681 domain-containing protein [Sphingobium sp.]
MTHGNVNPPRRRRSSAGGATSNDQRGNNASPEPEEKVGYGNPPKQHRWKKGTSGNPKGKAPGTKSLQTLIEQELDVVLEVIERGKKRKYSKRRVAAMRIVNKAVEGDDKSLTVLLRREGNMPVAPSVAPVSDEPLSFNEQSILDHFMDAARIAVERELRERGT